MAATPPIRVSASPALGRRLVAEFLGTALLVLFGAGSVVAALRTGNGALDYPGLGMVAFAFAFVIAVAIFAFGTTSGAHINPAVTIALTARGRFPPAEAGPYVVAQVVGAVAGALLILAAFGDHAVDVGLGTTTLAPGVSVARGIVAEAIGTFLLITAVFALAVDRRGPAGWAGLGIGLSVAAAILVVGPLTGGSLNPARTFGPLLVLSLWNGATNWGDLWAYVVGPIVGGVLAAYAYDLVARPREAEPAGREPAQGTAGPVTGHRE
ncbi:MAG: glycerol uptake facilitator protein [Thermoleophilales bacterium]|nr:glycerol uptake facilitator protein [Thermoleophilales bacterium]